MRVLPSAVPERRTAVELTDREIQFVERGLLKDSTNNDENGDLFEEFSNLREQLGLDQLKLR